MKEESAKKVKELEAPDSHRHHKIVCLAEKEIINLAFPALD